MTPPRKGGSRPGDPLGAVVTSFQQNRWAWITLLMGMLAMPPWDDLEVSFGNAQVMARDAGDDLASRGRGRRKWSAESCSTWCVFE